MPPCSAANHYAPGWLRDIGGPIFKQTPPQPVLHAVFNLISKLNGRQSGRIFLQQFEQMEMGEAASPGPAP